MNNTIRAWICAMRPRTLPLSLSVIFLGSSLAAVDGAFSLPIFICTVITGVLLQTLSDFANDYGDAQKNLDGDDRVGPRRTVSSGDISPRHMLLGIFCVIILIIINSFLLFSLSFGTNWLKWFIFSMLLICAIWAAISYTMGKKPYGYKAQGDYYVFIFFGLVSVLGSYYLFTSSFAYAPILPAIAAGLFSTAVLNINNTRDMEADSKRGKYTIANRLGPVGARIYQVYLISGGILAWLIFLGVKFGLWQMMFIFLTIPLCVSTYKVFTSCEAQILDKQLRITALSIACFHIIMAAALPFM